MVRMQVIARERQRERDSSKSKIEYGEEDRKRIEQGRTGNQ